MFLSRLAFVTAESPRSVEMRRVAWRGQGQDSGPGRPVNLPCEATLALSEHLRFAEIDNIDPMLSSAALHADLWSDPRDESGYSAEDLLSLGFSASAPNAALVKEHIALAGA